MEKELSETLAAMQERNKRVETDKAWETSWTRRLFIAALTYVATVIFMSLNHLTNAPMLQALIPPGAYLLSTLTLPPLKKLWRRRQH